MYHIKVEGIHKDEEWERNFTLTAPTKIEALEKACAFIHDKTEEISFIEIHNIR